MTIRYISVHYIYGHSGGVWSRAHLYSYIAYHSILNISTLWMANIYIETFIIFTDKYGRKWCSPAYVRANN